MDVSSNWSETFIHMRYAKGQFYLCIEYIFTFINIHDKNRAEESRAGLKNLCIMMIFITLDPGY